VTPASEISDVADQLHSAAIHLLRQLRKEDDASGLSAPRLSALSVIVFGGPLSLGQLARAEQVRPPTMTRIVTALEREGLVSRTGDPGDRRLTLIEATAKGRQILIAGRARRVEKLVSAVSTLSKTEQTELARGVRITHDVIARMRGSASTRQAREASRNRRRKWTRA
jgi:DNA-binding MarR family transcriptional regulator